MLSLDDEVVLDEVARIVDGRLELISEPGRLASAIEVASAAHALSIERRRAVGQSIRHLRKQAGLSRRTLASIAGTSMGYLKAVEEGTERPSRGYVAMVTAAIAEALADTSRAVA